MRPVLWSLGIASADEVAIDTPRWHLIGGSLWNLCSRFQERLIFPWRLSYAVTIYRSRVALYARGGLAGWRAEYRQRYGAMRYNRTNSMDEAPTEKRSLLP
jgi:hypothetical protein